jgi:hypothetical protein
MKVGVVWKADELRGYLAKTPRVRIPRDIRKGMNAVGAHARAALKQNMVYPSRNARRSRLRDSVRYKVFANRSGNFGIIVAPMGATARHRHLVELGHRQVGHRPAKTPTGVTVRGNPRITEAAPKVESIIAKGVQEALDKMMATDD